MKEERNMEAARAKRRANYQTVKIVETRNGFVPQLVPAEATATLISSSYIHTPAAITPLEGRNM